MNIFRLTAFLFVSLLLSGCRNTSGDCRVLSDRMMTEFTKGNFSGLDSIFNLLKLSCKDLDTIRKADSLCQVADRIELDFPFNEQSINDQLKKRKISYTEEEKADWEGKNWLESTIINGEKRYFRRAVSNLQLIKDFYHDRSARDTLNAHDRDIIFRKNHTREIIRSSEPDNRPVVPVKMTVNYTLTVNADVVPEGRKIRCWLPYPRADQERQKDVVLLSASAEKYMISPDSAIHSTIYMESEAVKGLPVVFSVKYIYQSSGQYFDPSAIAFLPYRTETELFRKYTAEEPPQINFSDPVRRLADSITGDEKQPYKIVSKIFRWFNRNIPWAGALEYSTMPDIPGYVIRNRRGDCGMQTFLLMSMLRYKGIPVRWQSGWMVPPGAENLHDWCEVYYEGTGWVPVDISYGLQYSADPGMKEFYVTGIDSYRLIVNNGISGRLFPAKRFVRSEPFDFQRGEVEWEGGNLYFDKWDYNMEITYNQ
jgi:transglutaminase-like putative cysteine protease